MTETRDYKLLRSDFLTKRAPGDLLCYYHSNDWWAEVANFDWHHIYSLCKACNKVFDTNYAPRNNLGVKPCPHCRKGPGSIVCVNYKND